MRKIIIPTILAATVLIAGIFAFMPVQKASTVHTAIIAALSSTAVGAGGITSASIATDAIGSDELAASGVTEINAAVLAALADQDGDGVLNTLPPPLGDNCPLVFDPANADIDGDGVGDVCDAIVGPGS